MVDLGISCSVIRPYYAPISAIMTLGFILGVPGFT